MKKLHHIVIEHPAWFTSGRFYFKPKFLTSYFLKINEWAIARMEKDSIEDMEQLQLSRLKNLLDFASDNIEYWKEIFRSNNFRNIGSVEEFKKIPITDKKILQARPIEDFTAKFKGSRFFPVTSFGTTGRPLRFYLDTYTRERRAALRFRVYRWLGAKRGDIFLKVVRNAIFYEKSVVIKAADFSALPKVKDFLYSLENSDHYILDSYPSFLIFLANLIKKERNALPLRAVISSAESVSNTEQKILESVFCCPTGRRYTSREGSGTIAQTCRLGAFHLNIDQVFVEIVDNDYKSLPVGATGKIIITDFNNYAMPFIRYELGDLGSYDHNPCSCGLPFPVFRFEGRSMGVFKLPSGKIIHSFSLISLLHRRREWVYQYQIIREARDIFNFLIVPGAGYMPGDEEMLMSQLEEIFDDDILINIKIVPKIIVPQNERFRPFISKVADDAEFGRFEKFQSASPSL